MKEEIIEKELTELKEEVNKLKEGSKRRAFYMAAIVLLGSVMLGSYTIAYKIRTATNEKNYYEELLRESGK